MQQQTGTTVFIRPPRLVASLRRALRMWPLALTIISVLFWIYAVAQRTALPLEAWRIQLLFIGLFLVGQSLTWVPL